MSDKIGMIHSLYLLHIEKNAVTHKHFKYSVHKSMSKQVDRKKRKCDKELGD